MQIFICKSNFCIMSVNISQSVMTDRSSVSLSTQRGSESHSKEVRVSEVSRWLQFRFDSWRIFPPFSRSHDSGAPALGVALCRVVATNKEGSVRVACRWRCGRHVLHTLLRPVQSNHREHLHNICSSACSRSASTSSTTRKRKFNRNNKTQCVDSSDCLLATTNQIKEINMSATIQKVLDRTDNILMICLF